MNLRGQVYNDSQQGLSWGRADPLGPHLLLAHWLFPHSQTHKCLSALPLPGASLGKAGASGNSPQADSLAPQQLQPRASSARGSEDSLKNVLELESESPFAHPRNGRGTMRTRSHNEGHMPTLSSLLFGSPCLLCGWQCPFYRGH